MDKRKGAINRTKSGHGPGRFMVPNQFITEQTSKEGNVHGLRRQILKEQQKIIFMLAKNGQESSSVHFDFDLNEISRNDPFNLLKDITSQSIRR